MTADWRDRAACRGMDTTLFVGDAIDGTPRRDAIPVIAAVCDRCPVTVECLTEAKATDSLGWWAGTTPADRHQRRTPARYGDAGGIHGTRGCYERGCRCDACYTAQRTYRQTLRERAS